VRRGLVVVCGLALVLAGGGPGPAAAAVGSETYASRLLRLVNAERARHGVRPLQPGVCAGARAEQWAATLARRGSLHHQSMREVLRACRVSRAGENIGEGTVSADGMMRLWMNSPRHRANILDPHFTYIGIGAARGSHGTWYAVQVFLAY
jgi:uncharacterized protein YkwD